MSTFASQWQRALSDNLEYKDLSSPQGQQSEAWTDYLGIWGHNKVNINTAPAEVIEAAFEPLGFTTAMAQALVEHRREKPFSSTGQINDVKEIDQSISRAVRALTTIQSDTFSVLIKARLGRAQYNLFAAIYKSTNDQLLTQAVFAGE